MTIGAVPRCCGYYGEGSGPINVRVVSCTGFEPNITSCSFVTTTVYNHQNDVGVQCQQGQSFLVKYINYVWEQLLYSSVSIKSFKWSSFYHILIKQLNIIYMYVSTHSDPNHCHLRNSLNKLCRHSIQHNMMLLHRPEACQSN